MATRKVWQVGLIVLECFWLKSLEFFDAYGKMVVYERG